MAEGKDQEGGHAGRNALQAAVELEFGAMVERQGPVILVHIALSERAIDVAFSIGRALFLRFVQAYVRSGRRGGIPLFRGVSPGHLPHVVAQGVDVIPTDSVIFANDLEKAMEYGGDRPIVMVFDSGMLRPSWTYLPADAPDAMLDKARADYRDPGEFDPERNEWYFSRLPKNDRRRGTPYEAENGWYIPGDPHEALGAVIVFESGEP